MRSLRRKWMFWLRSLGLSVRSSRGSTLTIDQVHRLLEGRMSTNLRKQWNLRLFLLGQEHRKTNVHTQNDVVKVSEPLRVCFSSRDTIKVWQVSICLSSNFQKKDDQRTKIRSEAILEGDKYRLINDEKQSAENQLRKQHRNWNQTRSSNLTQKDDTDNHIAITSSK